MTSHVNAPSSGSAPRPVSPASAGPLPKEYGVTRLVILPRDPRWIHAYWEVAPYTWDEARKQFGDMLKQGRSVLRVHSSRSGKSGFFDVDVRVDARNWYVHSPEPDGDWHAELGLVLPDGRFVLLAISNRIRLPAGQVSDITDERWGVLQADWERLFELSGGGRLGAGSLDVVKILAQRWELLRNVSSASLIPTSPGGASWGRMPSLKKEKGFWLVADTEVIVYGATEPDASLTFQGHPVALNPDGTFSFRFSLPDGEQVFPIHATHRDGDLSRSIEFRVTRRSHKSE
ncbi:MAG: DUF4912 domain-containing protein [Elusimicrobia bacterium]|nr:DUF4912 domain-containing protein [Elusimicrobiota bacterium]MBP9127716.1 DUF4912 domain-containing protein [Elusimicrobiota bacterium]MBP9699440.1 DUF4912 domain-containing protein [Elusimicrobiota bacterium]